MTAKEFLKQYRDIEADIDALLEEIKRFEQISERAKLTDIQEAYLARHRCTMGSCLVDLVVIKESIERLINKIPDKQQQRVLRLHYINGYSFQRIANILHYTRENVFCIHRKALKNVEIIMQQDNERKGI